MGHLINFTKEAWEQYLSWQRNDKRIFIKINELIKECLRTPFEGSGKPEPLKRNLSGFWSRRIDDAHRFVYKYENGNLFILSCKFHY
ncbi:MAG: Txe/YoeB family addiction module toxin [bacterium]